jgi:BlaI family penicillinase repressor
MVRRMEAKGLITYDTVDRAKRFSPALPREEAAIRETHSLLERAYQGSIGLLVSSLVNAGELSKSDIDELYAILKEAEGDAT